MDLRLHHHGQVAFAEQTLRGRIGLFDRDRHLAVGNRHAVLPQNFFRLVLVNLHGWSSR
jgi:hypothetical protein